MIEFVFLSGGRLFMAREGSDPRLVPSEFLESVRRRAQEIHRRHEWKGGGGGFGAVAWGRGGASPTDVEAAVNGVTRGASPGTILYSLEIDRLSAVLAFDPASSVERRLLHGSERRIRGVSMSPDGARLACALGHPDGTASIALLSPEGQDLTQVTEGDSIDGAPSWSPDSRRIAYHSAGVARTAQGAWAGVGRSQIHILDVDGGAIASAGSDPAFDCIQPSFGPTGDLYYLKRPPADRAGVWPLVKDVFAFPFRLAGAVFHYLNFFSARYSGKPLTTAGGRGRVDARRLAELSNLIDASRPEGPGADADAGPDQTLVRVGPGGDVDVIARRVIAFAPCAHGVLVARASGIHRIADGRETRLASARADALLCLAG